MFVTIRLYAFCILDTRSVLSNFSGLYSSQCFYEYPELNMCVNSDDVVHKLFILGISGKDGFWTRHFSRETRNFR